MSTPSFHVVIPCAGSGSRSGSSDVPKQYRPVLGRPMVLHTLDAFVSVDHIERIVLVVSPEDTFDLDLPAQVERLASGGATRAQSVLAGLFHLRETGADLNDWVLVHDAARCLISPELIVRLINECCDDDVGGLLAIPLADTLKEGFTNHRVRSTLSREAKWLAQTPQMFRLQTLIQALEQTGSAVTDESSAMEALGHAPKLVLGSAENLKVTYPSDWTVAEALLSVRVGNSN